LQAIEFGNKSITRCEEKYLSWNLKIFVHDNENLKKFQIEFFCNKFRSIMKLSLIMDKYSTIVNGLPK
jgi:hypothetical protein